MSIDSVILRGTLQQACANGLASTTCRKQVGKFHLKSLRMLRDNYLTFNSEDCPNFWIERIVVQIGCCPYIRSATFIPKDLSVFTTLVVRKGKTALPPFQRYFNVDTLESMIETLKGLDGVIYGEIRTCLEYFYQDNSLTSIGLTYKDATGEFVTCGWFKI